MRSYLKKERKTINPAVLTADELIAKTLKRGKTISGVKLKCLALFCLAVPLLAGLVFCMKNAAGMQEGENIFVMASAPISAAAVKKDLIAIPAGTVKSNPFLPYRDIGGKSNTISDVPKFDLIEPPEAVNENSDAARLMDTIVSGILYDKYSPSAILNIEGNDYLVKKGDVVNNYKVLNIMQDSVTVKLGNNTYKAGIGEILTNGSVNHNQVSNLNKKFGGERQ